MDNLAVLGRWIVILGIGLVVVGGIFWLLGKIPGLSSLPGTIKIQGNGFSCVFPLLASIVVSILLTVILNLIIRFLNK